MGWLMGRNIIGGGSREPGALPEALESDTLLMVTASRK